ncbi:MAG: bifunctional 3-(3-hydroxy-phenyl)propionate/3-hydroxycinnamic acid hydroxylase [Ktedonobacteraceae bacterium]|nr:bifunctional 3-(3-hydroxy-phenyl)propionate/3-hydroxycinnamic acid hydroxylase [Ktedonobacteraceae bacterium]
MTSVSEDGQASSYPVVIVGGGPTGLTLANLLAIEGIPTLLIERHTSTVQEPRAVSIDDEALRTMQAIGIVDEVLKQIVPGYGSHYYSPRGGCFVRVEPIETSYGYPRRNAFRQPILERQLRESLDRFSHVEARFSYTLDSFTQDAVGVLLHVTEPGGRHIQIACDYLVGCDGANSTVRDLLGIALEGSTFNERWLIVDLENSENPSPHTRVFCDPERPCITLPGPNRTRRFEFKLHPLERDEDLLAPEVIAKLLSTHEADPGSTIIRKVVYKFHARMATRWSEGRVFLAGDAVHLMPPFAGQGMNTGIRDAHNLAWKLVSVVRGRAGPGILDTYEEERRRHAAKMIQLSLQMGMVMAPPNYWWAWAIQNAFRVLGIFPAAQDYIAQMKYKPGPRFLSGFIIPDAKHHSLVGSLFPQPYVETKEQRNMLLDEVLENGFSLLARTSQPDRVFAQMTQPVWDRLQVRRVAVLPQNAPWCLSPGITVVREIDHTLAAALAGYPDHLILLRPDHYVAACIPAADIARGSDLVGTLLQKTWRAPEEANLWGERAEDSSLRP